MLMNRVRIVKRFVFWSAAVGAVLMVGLSSSAAHAVQQNHALVIGINNYESGKIEPLKTAVNDAHKVGEVLERMYGYEVTILADKDATKRNVYTTLADLRSEAKEEDNVVVYFAGHGEVDDLGAYWLPVDADPPGQPGAESTWIPSSLIRDNLSAFQNRHVLIISDSCFAGGLISTRGVTPQIEHREGWIEKVESRKSRWILTSGSNEPVADATEVSSEHSVFAFFLIDAFKALKEHPFTVQDLANNVQRNVGNNSWQTPRANAIVGSGDLGGQIIFRSTSAKDYLPDPNSFQPDSLMSLGPVAAVPRAPNRPLLISGISAVAFGGINMAIAGWSKQQYLASEQEKDRERYRKLNQGFGYSGIGIGIVGGAMTAWSFAVTAP